MPHNIYSDTIKHGSYRILSRSCGEGKLISNKGTRGHSQGAESVREVTLKWKIKKIETL